MWCLLCGIFARVFGVLLDRGSACTGMGSRMPRAIRQWSVQECFSLCSHFLYNFWVEITILVMYCFLFLQVGAIPTLCVWRGKTDPFSQYLFFFCWSSIVLLFHNRRQILYRLCQVLATALTNTLNQVTSVPGTELRSWER
jgi:hypothetical protein